MAIRTSIKIKSLNSSIIYVLVFFICGCYTTKITNTWNEYDLTSPDALFILPDTLREISGITKTEGNNFACIQDENGILFIYDAIRNQIVVQYFFNADGDYEMIARVEDIIRIKKRWNHI